MAKKLWTENHALLLQLLETTERILDMANENELLEDMEDVGEHMETAYTGLALAQLHLKKRKGV